LGFLIIVRGMGVFRDHFRCDIRWQSRWLRIEITAGRWLIIIDGPTSIAYRNESEEE